MTTTDTFAGLVLTHEQNLQSQLKKTLDTRSNQSVPMCDWVLWQKVAKHTKADNTRKAAQYVKMRLEEFPQPLSEWLKNNLRMIMNLRATQREVQYLNAEGEWRAFPFTRAK